MAGYRRGLRLPGAVVVVAGGGAAGRATADALAAHGARPVLLGAGADTPDLGDPDAVQEAAQQTLARHGRIDGWVQFADGGVAGGLLELAPAQVGRALETAVLGVVHGARAALPRMAAQGSGVLVVVASVHGQVARPFAAAPGMAGAALRVLAAALRQELRLGGVRGVAVTTVLAPERAGSVPAGSAGRVAATVLGRLRHPGLEKVAGGPVAKAVVHGHALVPGLTEWLVARRFRAASYPPSPG